MTPLAEVERTIDLNRFLMIYYWRDRSPFRFVGAVVRHLRLVLIRARVETER